MRLLVFVLAMGICGSAVGQVPEFWRVPVGIGEVTTGQGVTTILYYHADQRTYRVGSHSWVVPLATAPDGRRYWDHKSAEAPAMRYLWSLWAPSAAIQRTQQAMTFGAVNPVTGRR